MSIHPIMQKLAAKLERTDLPEFRIVPYNSKVVDKVEKVRSYEVRRSKLFYLRGLRGKAARLREVERAAVS
jgi:hypothetical protein